MLTLLGLVFAFGAHAQIFEEGSLPMQIRSACVETMSQVEPENLGRMEVTPAVFCTCVAKRHAIWARDDVGGGAQGEAYLRRILILYTPANLKTRKALQKKYPGEAEDYFNFGSTCTKRPQNAK